MARRFVPLSTEIRTRLVSLTRSRSLAFDLLLTQYGLERLLYRLGQSGEAHRFALKGQMLMATGFETPPTASGSKARLGPKHPDPLPPLRLFRKILTLREDDGLTFKVRSFSAEPLGDDVGFRGVRLRILATLDDVRIRVPLDLAFTDAIEPGLETFDYPLILDMPSPSILAYARETVVAETLQAMVALGWDYGRMKDFYDVWVLYRFHTFDADRLARAIVDTFERLKTPIPSALPDALTSTFGKDEAKQGRWRAFVADLEIAPQALDMIREDLALFLGPHLAEARARVATG